MKKNKLSGLGDVFKFTFVQSMKSKAMIITIVIFCVLALISMPALSLIKGESVASKEEINEISILNDEYGIGEAIKNVLNESDDYSDVKTEMISEADKEDYVKKTIADSESKKLFVNIIYVIEEVATDKDMISSVELSVVYGKDNDAMSEAASDLTSFFEASETLIKCKNAGIGDEFAKIYAEDISFNCYAMDENGKILSDGITESQYLINYALLMITLISVSFAGAKISEQIVTEKATKVIEYILITVDPMALITGKVLASLCVIGVLMLSTIASFVASGFINGLMLAGSGGEFMLPEVITNLFDADVVTGANIYTVVISVVILVLGFVFYGFIAGLAGASVSKIEELAEGNKLFTFVMIIGAYLSLGLIMSSQGGSGWGDMNYLVYFLPLSAPFIVPAYMLFGIISPSVGLAIIAVNVVVLVLLAWFVSRVFETLIYHNGEKIKLKQMLQMTKGGKK